MQTQSLPKRVRVLVIGGGIHGAGVLHDLASRGWRDVHLVEKSTIGCATSSQSTKLIHGGLRYLRHVGDYGLVMEALRERTRLMSLVPDLVKPVELLFPILKSGGMPAPVVRSGLWLYDLLAGRSRIHRHRLVSDEETTHLAPILSLSAVKRVYSFWDGQTDDLALVERVAASAQMLGAGITENAQVVRLMPSEEGWAVTVGCGQDPAVVVSAKYVVNAAGPWANRLLAGSGIKPEHEGVNNKGVHLVFEDIGLKAGLFLQSASQDGRIFFLLPWAGRTLLGTTEEGYAGDPDNAGVTERDVEYLLENCNRFLNRKLTRQDIRRVTVGLRWLATESGRSLTDTSRSYVLGEHASNRGMMITIYGGKLTTYRTLSAQIGDRICKHFGEFRSSQTDLESSWLPPEKAPAARDPDSRFTAYTA